LTNVSSFVITGLTLSTLQFVFLMFTFAVYDTTICFTTYFVLLKLPSGACLHTNTPDANKKCPRLFCLI